MNVYKIVRLCLHTVMLKYASALVKYRFSLNDNAIDII